jgi:hypothetical protein
MLESSCTNYESKVTYLKLHCHYDMISVVESLGRNITSTKLGITGFSS